MKVKAFLKDIKYKYPNLLEIDIKKLIENSLKVSYKNPKFFEQDFQPDILFKKNLSNLVKGMPIEYIEKESLFLGNKIYVDKRVLIPRSETEELSMIFADEICKNHLKSIADIGTGSGCISVFLHVKFPQLKIYAVDKSKKAFQVANRNFKKYNLNKSLFLGDALKPLIKNKIKIDGLICNPPYICKNEFVQDSVKKFEPKSALYITKISLFEKIFKDINKVATFPFVMFFEISPENIKLIKSLISKYLSKRFITKFEFLKDINGYNRFVRIVLKDER